MGSEALAKLVIELGNLVPDVHLVDGLVFIDRHGRGEDGLRAEIAAQGGAATAQKWINIVPIDGFIDCVDDQWDMDDPAVAEIAAIIGKVLLNAVEAKLGSRPDISFEVLRDEEHGDVWVRVSQK